MLHVLDIAVNGHQLPADFLCFAVLLQGIGWLQRGANHGRL